MLIGNKWDDFKMTEKKSPEENRERLRQQEVKNNPTGTLKDSIDKAEIGSSVDFTGSSNWKETGITILLILVVLIGYFGYKFLFQ